MEYEKKYNDLIARINEAKEKPSLCMKEKHHYNGYVETGIRDALDYIVNPESEDERVRTRLIALVESFGQGKYKDEMLAYLEKKKEQKPESCDCSRDEESYTNGIHHVLMNPEAYGLIKQKPAEQLGGTFTSYDIAKTFTEGQNYVIAHPEKFGLCKPADWSEEDEKMLKDVYESLYAYQCDIRAGIMDKNALELLKIVDKEKAWLKSLRPQPHWKPSEEQVSILGKIFAGCKLNTSERDSMVDLFYHLKDMI